MPDCSELQNCTHAELQMCTSADANATGQRRWSAPRNRPRRTFQILGFNAISDRRRYHPSGGQKGHSQVLLERNRMIHVKHHETGQGRGKKDR
jgi:hypothetical protein